MADRLKNPFASNADDMGNNESPSDDFIAFSSTSTPAKGHGGMTGNNDFKIKRGKSNRMGNWERFGAMNQPSPYRSQHSAWNQDAGNCRFRGSPNSFRGGGVQHQDINRGGTPNRGFQPFRRGTPRSEPMPRGGGGYRGAPGFFGTPNAGNCAKFQNNRGGRFDSNYRSGGRSFFSGGINNHRGRGGGNWERFSPNSIPKGSQDWEGYFHPSMLEDPWAPLRGATNKSITNCDTSSCSESKQNLMSDSMIPQVGDTIFERNDDLEKTESFEGKSRPNEHESLDNSQYSDSEDDNIVITIGSSSQNSQIHSKYKSNRNIDVSAPELPAGKDPLNGRAVMSDSLIPMVGDSILVDETMGSQGQESIIEES